MAAQPPFERDYNIDYVPPSMDELRTLFDGLGTLSNHELLTRIETNMTDSTNVALAAQMEANCHVLTLLREHMENGWTKYHDRETCEVCLQYPHWDRRVSAEQYLDDLPLEIVKEVGTPLAVVLTTGGSRLEIVKDSRGGSARLEGYWGSEHITRHDEVFQWALDYFIPED